jgi:hypothetical protein
MADIENRRMCDLSFDELNTLYSTSIERHIHVSNRETLKDDPNLEDLQQYVRQAILEIFSCTLFLMEPMEYTYTQLFVK